MRNLPQVQFIAVLAVCSALCPGNTAPPEVSSPEALRQARWQTALRASFSRVSTNIVLDIPSDKVPFSATLPANSRQAIERYGWALGRDLKVYGETLGLLRTPLPPTLDDRGSSGPLLAILETLDPSMLKRVASDGVNVAELPTAFQREVLRIADGDSAVLTSLLEGRPVGISVSGDIMARSTDPRTGRTVQSDLIESNYSVAVAAVKRLSKAPPKMEEIPGSTEKGKFVYSETDGKVMTLDELISRVRTDFKRNVEYDTRLGQSLVFVKGQFTLEDLLRVTLELAKAEPPHVNDWSRVSRAPRIASILGRLGSAGKPKLGKIAEVDIDSGRAFSRGELELLSPPFARSAAAQQFDANGDYRIVRRIAISLFSPRSSSATAGSMTWVIMP